MTKVHSTLKPSTNIAMILLWGFFALITAFISRPYSYPVVVVGLISGVLGGIMQSLAFAESKVAFANASTLMDIRKQLKNTKWGRRYIPFLWTGNLTMAALVILLGKGNWVVEIMAGCFSLMFIREIITLKPTFELAELSKNHPGQTP